MRNKRSEDQLTRFVWSRNAEYDYLLLLEVQSKNPFSFKKPKVIWEEIATTLRKGHPKMRVTERSCRDRTNELLKKYRKDEGVIIRSTGATDDKLTEIKQLLTIINEMALTKPNDSSLYHKKTRTDGESIRDAALNEISGSDTDDDYIHGKYLRSDKNCNSRGTSHQKSTSNGEMGYITSVGGYFNDQPMSLAEEEEMMRRERDFQIDDDSQVAIDVDAGGSAGLTDRQSVRENESWKNVPSTSRDHQYSIPLELWDTQIINRNDNGNDLGQRDVVVDNRQARDSAGATPVSTDRQYVRENDSWKDGPSTSRDDLESFLIEYWDSEAVNPNINNRRAISQGEVSVARHQVRDSAGATPGSTDRQSVREKESWKNVPSTSRDHQYSVPLQLWDTQIINRNDNGNDIGQRDVLIDDRQTRDSAGATPASNHRQSVREKESWKNVPSTSRDHQYSVPLQLWDTQIINRNNNGNDIGQNDVLIDNRQARDSAGVTPASNHRQSVREKESSKDQDSVHNEYSDSEAVNPNINNRRVISQREVFVARHQVRDKAGAENPSSSYGSSVSAVTAHKDKASTSKSHSAKPSPPKNNSSSNRFSNPKKDLIVYLDKKSENEMICRTADNRIREMEMKNKKEELDILRLKTVQESDERKRSLELEAENKKEELRILRLRTEAEVEERKQMLALLSNLIAKNN